jgi:hypothetical protein
MRAGKAVSPAVAKGLVASELVAEPSSPRLALGTGAVDGDRVPGQFPSARPRVAGNDSACQDTPPWGWMGIVGAERRATPGSVHRSRVADVAGSAHRSKGDGP